MWALMHETWYPSKMPQPLCRWGWVGVAVQVGCSCMCGVAVAMQVGCSCSWWQMCSGRCSICG